MAWWVPLAIAAAGAATGYAGERSAERRRGKLTDAMTAYRLGKAKEGRAASDTFAQTLAPQAREAETTAIRDALAKNLTSSVDVTKGFETPQDFSGKVSTDYATRRGTGREQTSERLRRAIEQLSVTGAPGQRDLQEGFRYGAASRTAGSANTAAQNVSGAYGNAIEQSQPSSLNRFASQLLTGLGIAGLASGAGRKPPAPKTVVTSGGNYGLA